MSAYTGITGTTSSRSAGMQAGRASFGEDMPMGRPGQPAELAAVYAVLASNEDSYVTGQVYGAVGGRGGP